MTWVFLYLLILILAAIRIAASTQTTLLRGKTVLIFNLFFIFLIFLNLLITQSFPSKILMAFLVIIFLYPFVIKNKWILFRGTLIKTQEIIERCLTMILTPFEKLSMGYDLKILPELAKIVLYGFLPGVAIMRFEGKQHQKKVEVLKVLLIKNFQGIFPRIVIHLKTIKS